MISVIVPVYNTEKYLRRCVDAILSQTVADFELLLIDDGSTDKSGEICDEYAVLDPRVRVFHKCNGGVSSARNLGLDNAKGEWIAFADSDDYVYSCWLENFDFTDSGGYDLLCQAFDATNPGFGLHRDKNKIMIEVDNSLGEYISKSYSENALGYLFVRAFRRSIIESHGLRFDQNIKLREDELFLFSYYNLISNVKSTAKVGYHYCNNSTGNKYQFNLKERELVDLSVINVLKNLGFTVKDDIFNHFCEDLVGAYYIAINSCVQKRVPFRNEIKGLQNALKFNYKKSRIFKPAKLLLRYDHSGLISELFYKLYFTLRPL